MDIINQGYYIPFKRLPKLKGIHRTPSSGTSDHVLSAEVDTWLQKGACIGKAIQLAHSFHLNFDKYASEASTQIIEGEPLIDEHHHLYEHF